MEDELKGKMYCFHEERSLVKRLFDRKMGSPEWVFWDKEWGARRRPRRQQEPC